MVYCEKFILQLWEKLITKTISDESSNPIWWDNYNSINHSDKPDFMKATLRTASYMAGMFDLLVVYGYKRLGDAM